METKQKEMQKSDKIKKKKTNIYTSSSGISVK